MLPSCPGKPCASSNPQVTGGGGTHVPEARWDISGGGSSHQHTLVTLVLSSSSPQDLKWSCRLLRNLWPGIGYIWEPNPYKDNRRGNWTTVYLDKLDQSFIKNNFPHQTFARSGLMHWEVCNYLNSHLLCGLVYARSVFKPFYCSGTGPSPSHWSLWMRSTNGWRTSPMETSPTSWKAFHMTWC